MAPGVKRIAIVDGVRTPIGVIGGALKDLTAVRLAEIALRELLARTKLDPAKLEEVILGCCGQSSDAPNIARVAALRAGVPIHVPAYTVMRNCASGIQAIIGAAQNILAGDADVQIAGGVESMSNMPYVLREMRFGQRMRNCEAVDTIWEGLTDPVCNQIMGRTAENLAEEFGITRADQDAYAVESHRRAFRATRERFFEGEIAPVEVPKKVAGREVAPDVVRQDEGINVSLNVQTLALYPTAFKKEGGTVTPGNACQISDAAGALLLMSDEKAKDLGYKPIGYLRAWAVAALEPHRMGLGPSVAAPKALAKAKMSLRDIDLIEINEAFAVQVLACQRAMGFDLAKTNIHGGAIALGHPVGFTGIRIVHTLLRGLAAKGFGTGLATLCVGGGQGAAVVVTRE